MKTLMFKDSTSGDQRISVAVVIDPKLLESLLIIELIGPLEFLDCLNVLADSHIMRKTCHDLTKCFSMLVVFRSAKYESKCHQS